MLRLILLLTLFMVYSCAPQGSYKSQSIPEGGGYGTKVFVGSKITGNFSSGNVSATSEDKCTDCKQTYDDGTWVKSDFIVINNSWVRHGDFEYYTPTNQIKWLGNKNAYNDTEIFKYAIYKGEKIEIDSEAHDYLVDVVVAKYNDMIDSKKKEEKKIQEAKFEKENIERKKQTCTSLGFEDGSELHGQCILEIIKTERELALKEKELEILKMQADANEMLALSQAAQANALQRQSDLNSSLQLLQLSQELLTPQQPTYTPSINCITNPMGWTCY